MIVVGLFTNDFSTQLNPGEQWASEDQLVAAFTAAYAPFFAELHRRAPTPRCWSSPALPGQPRRASRRDGRGAHRSVTAAAQAAGIRASVSGLPGLGVDMSACDLPPEPRRQPQARRMDERYLEAHPGLWQGDWKARQRPAPRSTVAKDQRVGPVPQARPPLGRASPGRTCGWCSGGWSHRWVIEWRPSFHG